MGYLHVTDGKKTSDVELKAFDFVVEPSPAWDDVSEASRCRQVSFFVENRGKTAHRTLWRYLVLRPSNWETRTLAN
jgi:hypothetical protein